MAREIPCNAQMMSLSSTYCFLWPSQCTNRSLDFRPFPTSIFSTIPTSGIQIRNTAHIYYHPLTRKSSNYVPVTQHWWLSAKCPCPRSYLEEQLPLSWSLKQKSSKKDSLQNSPQLPCDLGDSVTLWTIWFSSFYFSIYRIYHHL